MHSPHSSVSVAFPVVDQVSLCSYYLNSMPKTYLLPIDIAEY